MGAFLVEDEIKNIIEEIYELFPILREKRNLNTSFFGTFRASFRIKITVD